MSDIKRVYVDNAATTKVCDEAFSKMMPLYKENFGNPSGVYAEGVYAKRIINEARHEIAKTLGAYDKEIIFTAGGSEADNLALIGVMEALREKGRHIVTTNIEHHAILETCSYLEKHGYRVTYVPVQKNGIVDIKDIEKAICDDTVLVSVMFANNELGTIQPIDEIGRLCKEKNVLFHTDAVQAYTKFSIDVNALNIDLLSASSHKFYGPKGAGFLYVKSGTPIKPFIHGGSQERRLRAGTENVPAIAGMGEASKVSYENMEARSMYEASLISYLWELIKTEIPDVKFNGDMKRRLPNILNVTFDGVEGESLLISLDMKGIAASTGSACAMSDEEPSHVLRAIGRSYDEARGSVRFSVSHKNTMEEMEYIAESLKSCVDYLRNLQ